MGFDTTGTHARSVESDQSTGVLACTEQHQPSQAGSAETRMQSIEVRRKHDVQFLSLPSLPLFLAAKTTVEASPEKVAVIDQSKSESFTYLQLLVDASLLKRKLVESMKGNDDLASEEPRIAFLVPAGYDYVVSQWAIWAAGAICVPLCTTHPIKELLYTISDSDPSLIIVHSAFQSIEPELKEGVGQTPFMRLQSHQSYTNTLEIPTFVPAFPLSRRALMIYTSGTTSKPKGCVTTHHNITFQAKSLVEAWKYSAQDHLIHVLPLHHIHGIINGLTATLLAGGTVEMYPKFSPKDVWDRWGSIGSSTMFMAVPTVYSRLIEYFNSALRGTDAEAVSRTGAASLRLLISGSAALPTPIKAQFQEITDQVLLERYGMTEIGMALSCGLDVDKRIDGSVGWPLPGVQVRLVDPETGAIIDEIDREGAIEVRGDNVFLEYWRKPELTAKEFSQDGWFKTGDVAKCNDFGAYFIQGRASVDIIKSGGYKISALEVEREILALKDISEVVVVGVDDIEWGQRVAAVIKQKAGTPPYELQPFRSLLKTELAPYKIPTILKTVDAIDRNTMGKVNKKDIVKKHFSSTAA